MLFYTDIETIPNDDWKMVPDPKTIVDDILIKIKDFFVGKEKPVFPSTGKHLMQKYNLKEGLITAIDTNSLI